MSILVNEKTRVIFQGLGKAGQFHCDQCANYGTVIAGAVKPGKGGTTFKLESQGSKEFPFFDSMKEAVEKTNANTSVVFVPAFGAADAIMEAAEAGIELVICITEGIPTLDMAKVAKFLKGKKTRLVGPNCAGVITPGVAKIGIMPGYIHNPGKIGIISRSGTLTYEAVWQLTELGLGQSTCIGIGGDQIIGTSYIDLLKAFNDDPDTEAVIMIGEIGGNAEELAAKYIKEHFTKPVVSFIAGQTAPPGKRMGHAGAIISGSQGTAKEKMKVLREHGIIVAESPSEIGITMKKVLEK